MSDQANPPTGEIDLAHARDFPLGRMTVRPSIREVEHPGGRETLEPRIMQVLVALADAGGAVVSRDDLIARCWEGRIVGEDAINRAIGRLRRLSELDDGASFAIDTIPRIGYRLRAKTPPPAGRTSAIADPAPRQFQARSASRMRPIIGLAIGTAVLVVGLAAYLVWLAWPVRHWHVEQVRAFISTLALEGDPAFSPNGAMLAYSAGPDLLSREIYVRSILGGEALRITNDAYDDQSPSWSSDGARLAYVAAEPGQPCRIMITTVPAGVAREAGRCKDAPTASISWQADSPFIYYTDRTASGGDGIWRLNVDTGTRDSVVAQNPSSTSGKTLQIIPSLATSPDGKQLSYLHEEGYSRLDIVVRDLADGTEQTLGKVGILSAISWTDDSQTVLVDRSSDVGSEIWAYPRDGRTPYLVYATAVRSRDIAAGAGGLLAIETDVGRTNLARASPIPRADPDIIDPANGQTWAVTYAPDGTLAFLSNRSGENAVWTMKPGAAPVQLLAGGLTPFSRLRWSPDGTRLALVIAGGRTGVTLRVLTAQGAGIASIDLPSMGFGMPTWTPDGNGLIYFDRFALHTFRLDLPDLKRRTPAAAHQWDGVTILSNGTFATRADTPGIWRIDGGVTRIDDKYPGTSAQPLQFLGADVLIPDFAASRSPRILARPVTGGPDRILAYAPGADPQSTFAVDPKTGGIAYVAAVARDTNIDLVTLKR
ncbi:MAG: LpqB family beta-propeller domain-containing protein [Rhizomicrobium sp.]